MCTLWLVHLIKARPRRLYGNRRILWRNRPNGAINAPRKGTRVTNEAVISYLQHDVLIKASLHKRRSEKQPAATGLGSVGTLPKAHPGELGGHDQKVAHKLVPVRLLTRYYSNISRSSNKNMPLLVVVLAFFMILSQRENKHFITLELVNVISSHCSTFICSCV